MKLTPQEKTLIQDVSDAGSAGLLIATNKPRSSLIALALVKKGFLKRTHRLIGSIYTVSPTKPESEA